MKKWVIVLLILSVLLQAVPALAQGPNRQWVSDAWMWQQWKGQVVDGWQSWSSKWLNWPHPANQPFWSSEVPHFVCWDSSNC